MSEPDRAEQTLPIPPSTPDGDGGLIGAHQTMQIDMGGIVGGYAGGPLLGLETRDISAWFGERKVLDRVSLTMGAGEVTALIGPSGCGKSTFLRILNRMHEMVRGAGL